MPDLLTPLQIRQLKLPNRIVMPPMANNLATEEGQMRPELIKHYLGRPGVGLIIVEHSYVQLNGRVNQNQLGIYDDRLVDGLIDLVKAVHTEGNKIGIQITHAGSTTNKETIGGVPVAPSALKHPGRDNSEMPRELCKEEIAELKDSFVKAALRAKEAGFDLVEIHGAHGYLLNQFFSPLTNKREDEYGGSFENRLRLPLEIVTAVREAVGPNYPVFYRLGTDDLLAGGLTVEDGKKAAPRLAGAGIDVIDLSGGLRGYGPADNGPNFFGYLGKEIKPVTDDVSVLVTGGIKEPELANRIIAKKEADLVGIGRALLKDKLWADKAITELKK